MLLVPPIPMLLIGMISKSRVNFWVNQEADPRKVDASDDESWIGLSKYVLENQQSQEIRLLLISI